MGTMDLKIELPENFLKVLKKSSPEISEISIINFERVVNVLEMNFNPQPRFIIDLKIVIESTNTVKGDVKYYSNEINKIFNFVYSDMDFVNFYIKEFKVTPERSNDEKFISLFGVR